MHGELENDFSPFLSRLDRATAWTITMPVREQGDKRPRREIIGEFAS